MIESHEDAIFNTVFSPIGICVGLLWALCLGMLLICACIDTWNAANVAAHSHARLPRINEVPSVHDDIADIYEEEGGYATMDEYLHSRHNSTTSD